MRIKRARVISLEKLIWNSRVRKRTNKRLTIGMLVFIISFFVLFYCYQSLYPPLQKQFHLMGNVISEFGGEPTTAMINVDFSEEVGVVREKIELFIFQTFSNWFLIIERYINLLTIILVI